MKEEVKRAAKKGGKRRVHEEKKGGAGKEEERALSPEQIAKLLADKSEDLSPEVAYDVETLLDAVVTALEDTVNSLYQQTLHETFGRLMRKSDAKSVNNLQAEVEEKIQLLQLVMKNSETVRKLYR